MTLIVLLYSAYLSIRTPYPQASQNTWAGPLRHAYALWKVDIGPIARNLVLTVGLVLFLYTFRRWRQAELVRRPGPIEVTGLINATGDDTVNILELATAFRTVLGRVNLNSPAAVPGAGRPVEFLELLRGAANEKTMLGMVAGLLGLTSVTHAYAVTAVLRKRNEPAAPFGITVSVATLPRGGTPPHTVWASDWPLAVDQAAMAVGAAILPLTRLCRRPPWSDWRGLALPPALFGAYQQAKTFTAQRRYDEALGTFYGALELDPLNLHIRLEIGTLQEQLQLFLDALETYDDVIALGSRADERLAHAWSDRLLHGWTVLTKGSTRAALRSQQRAWHPLGEGWRGRRGERGIRPPAGIWRGSDRHRALQIARYRYAMVLGFSEVVVAQWLRGPDENQLTRRDPERERLRARLLPRLSHYTFRPILDDSGHRDARSVLVDIMPHQPDSPAEVQRLDRIEQRLRVVVGTANRIRERAPRCDETHEHFHARFKIARDLLADDRPASSRTLDKVAKSLLAATDLCADKDWSKVRAVAAEVLPELRPAPAPKLTALDILRAQELFQAASLTEVVQLQRDYRWFKGRRRRDHPISATAVRVSIVLAHLRQRRIHALVGAQLAAGSPDKEQFGPLVTWPPPLGEVSVQVTRALGRNPLAVHDWQDFYNAACVYAMLLLPHNNWAGLHLGHRLVQPDSGETEVDIEVRDHFTAEHAVRSLERAIDTSDSSFAAGQRSWLTFEDPDLVGFRSRREFAQFRGRNLTSAGSTAPLPKNVHVLQLSAYVTEILRLLASTQLDSAAAGFEQWTPARLSAWLERDRRCWQLLTELMLEYRDWRSRLRALHLIIQLAGGEVTRSPMIPYPTFPDARIGDLVDVSAAHDGRCINLAGRYARQERDEQFSRLRSIVLSGTVGQRQPEAADREAGHLMQQQLSAAEITSLGRDRVAAAFTQRRLAWEHIYDCLSINYFTDDKGQLKERKEREGRFEAQLALAVVASKLPSPGATARSGL
ncbi:hypothetical protein [Jatrophihabitans sp.]|uniref:hypothetical protein n=1 Tax=Jatrophihabitans sp. TaxID=1932789 RepID=UPI002F0164E0